MAKPTIFERYEDLISRKHNKQIQNVTLTPAPGLVIGAKQKIDQDSEIVKIIGAIVVEWGALERMIDNTIWTVMGVKNEIGACVTSQFIGPGPRCRALLSLCHQVNLDAELCNDVSAFKIAAQEYGEKRNRIIHDEWYQWVYTDGRKRIVLHQITSDAKLTYKEKEVLYNDMNNLLIKISDLAYVFRYAIRGKILDHVSAFHNRPNPK